MSETARPILYSMKQAAIACGVSLSLWKILVATGQTPAPCRLNTKVVFCVKQLELWSWAGCPSRDSEAWQSIIQKENNHEK